MSEWRDRGYVQDSDEDITISDAEDAGQELEDPRQIRSGAGAEAGTDGGHRKEAPSSQRHSDGGWRIHDNRLPALKSSQRGYQEGDFQDIDEVIFAESPIEDGQDQPPRAVDEAGIETQDSDALGPHPSDIFDIPSSPLEDLGSTTPSPPQSSRTLMNETLPGGEVSPRLHGLSPGHDDLEIAWNDVAPVNAEDIRSRTFRRRNPIQLHPYMLENEQYRASLRARGLRPVHVAQDGEPNHKENQNEESQWLESGPRDSSQSLGLEVDQGYRFASMQSPSSPGIRLAAAHQYRDDDELLELDTLLSRSVDGGLLREAKRLKTMHTLTSKGVRASALLTDARNPYTAADRRYEDADVFELPPSPVTTVSERNNRSLGMLKVGKFRLPRGHNQSFLPTPGPSSDAERSKKRVVQLDPSESPPMTRTRSSSRFQSPRQVESPYSISSDASPSPSPPKDLKRHAKRIKGVLPASWLMLDQRVQGRKPQGHKRPAESDQQDETVPLRGVAQKVARRPATPRDHTEGMMFSDRSDAEQSPRRVMTRFDLYGERASSPLPYASSSNLHGMADIDEGDWVDPMLPTTACRRRPLSSNKRRQMRLTESFGAGLPSQTRLAKQRHESGPDLKHLSRKQVREPLVDYPDNHQMRLPPPVKLRKQLQSDGVAQNSAGFGHTKTTYKSLSRHRLRQTNLSRTYDLQQRGDAVPVQRSGCDIRHRCKLPAALAQTDRPGQIQGVESNDDGEGRLSDFRRRLVNLDDEFDHRQSYQQRIANPLIGRFLVPDRADLPLDDVNRHAEHGDKRRASPKRAQGGSHQRHKSASTKRPFNELATPVELEVGASLDDPALHDRHRELLQKDQGTERCLLAGLGPYGTKYTCDFSIHPFPIGTFFDQCTFLGSGHFREALTSSERDLSEDNGALTYNYRHLVRRWSNWTVDVSSEIEQDMMHVLQAVSTNHLDGPNEASRPPSLKHGSTREPLRSIVSYFAKHISFSDAIDRSHCISSMAIALEEALESVRSSEDLLATGPSSIHCSREHLIRLTYLTVLAYQVLKISSDPLVTADQHVKTLRLFQDYAKETARTIASRHLPDVLLLLQECGRGVHGDRGIDSDRASAEALVVLNHLLRAAAISDFDIWDVLSEIFLGRAPATFSSVVQFEDCWRDVFTILPLLRIDSRGIATNGKSSTRQDEKWTFVKALVQRVFDLQTGSEPAQSAKMNSYSRATLSRCVTLIRSWGWTNSELILGCVYDFFAKRGFELLPQERYRRSPDFLDRLDDEPNLKTVESDRSFEIFLKMLGSTFENLRACYTSKKMKNMVWRFIPNHGRRHAKESELREDDLDAIRNQHHLLCVLYWAAPSTERIEIERIRDLVDIRTSHSEVCRVSIRSWTNLVRFQISSTEDVLSLLPFAIWFNALLNDLIYLHRHARVEAEANYAQFASLNSHLTKSDLETVIGRNEREVEGLLGVLLASMSSMLKTSKSDSAAKFLFEQVSLSETLTLFDPKRPRLGQLIALALDSYQTYFSLVTLSHGSMRSQQNSEESQEYGDWSDIENLAETSEQKAPSPDQVDKSVREVQQILSNCFGAERFDDQLLCKVVDVWTCACQMLVRRRQKSWTDFLDRHSSSSWYQLRSTEQTRMFTSLFFASVVTRDPDAYSKNMFLILEAWLCTLVQRESTLKYQHVLTNALLHNDNTHPLLQNLPFCTSPDENAATVSLDQLRQRRLALLSSVLDNMRRSNESAFLALSTQAHDLRQEYASILRQVMNEMKVIYEETQQGDSLKGAYVDFVQSIVAFMQQYASDILPIDKFFTDSAAFPLPTEDPTYVVARLKSYCCNLSDERSQKKLTTFLQAVSERAAVDNQQAYLTGQLVSSVDGLFDDGNAAAPSLRIFLLEALSPCYINKALSTDCGWILAVPVLKASTSIFGRIFSSFDLSDRVSWSIHIRLTSTFLRGIRAAIERVVANKMLLRQPWVSATVKNMIAAASSVLPLVDFLSRSMRTESEAAVHLTYLYSFAQNLIGVMYSKTSTIELNLDWPTDLQDMGSWKSISAFCAKELEDTLSKNWIKHNDEYYVLRGSSRKLVVVDLSTPEQELEDLVEALKDFSGVYKRMPGFRDP